MTSEEHSIPDTNTYTVSGTVKVGQHQGEVTLDVQAADEVGAVAAAEASLRKSMELLDDTPIEWIAGPTVLLHGVESGEPTEGETEELTLPKQGSNVEYHLTGTLTDKGGELYEIDVTVDALNEVEAILLVEADYEQPTWITGPLVISVDAEKSVRSAKAADLTELLNLSNHQIAVLESTLYRIERQREEVWKKHTSALAKARETALEFKELTVYITELKAMIPGKPQQKRMF